MCHCYLPLFVLKLVLHNVRDEYSLISLNTTEQAFRSSKISSCVFLYQEPKNKNQLQGCRIGVQKMEQGHFQPAFLPQLLSRLPRFFPSGGIRDPPLLSI